MKKNWRNSFIVFVMFAGLVFGACKNSDEHAEHADTYTCPMHPTVVSDRPGTCPVCGMDLVRKAREGEGVKITEDLARILKSPNEAVIATIKTIKAEYRSEPMSVEAQGIVTYDSRNIYTIPAPAGGRLERVFLKYAFQAVKKGQKVTEIYSPELITPQRELLYLLESDVHNNELIQSAKNKIKLLGASELQVATLIQRKEVPNTFTVYSPYTGYLVKEGGQAPSMSAATAAGSSFGGGMDKMGSSSNSSAGSTVTSQTSQDNQLLREGSYVARGQTLFRVINNYSLRVELDLPASMAGSVKKGTDVKMDFGDGKEVTATIDFIQPFFSEGEEFVKLRVYTDNREELRIGQLVKANLHVRTAESLWLPKEAVLDLGLSQIVFVKEHGVLKPKEIMLGVKANGQVEVKNGISTSDEIAANAQYLVDSESFVKAN